MNMRYSVDGQILVLGERKALNAARTIDPNSLDNDQSLAKNFQMRSVPKFDDRRRRFLRRSDLPLGSPQDRADGFAVR